MSNFGARDLSLFLSDDVEVVPLKPSKSKDETESFKELVPKIDKSKKVTRYFPQKAPAWLSSQEHSESGLEKPSSTQDVDKRLARLSRFTDVSAGSSRRRRYEAKVIESFDEEEDQVSEPPTTAFESIQVEKDEEEPEVDGPGGSLELEEPSFDLNKVYKAEATREVSDEESEYETDSEEEQEILKPVFVPKAKRETILEYERKLAEEESLFEKKQKALEERKQQSRILVAESVKRQDDKREADATDADSDTGMPDDTDDLDEEEEVSR